MATNRVSSTAGPSVGRLVSSLIYASISLWLAAATPTGHAATMPTLTIQPITQQLQENFKNPGGFTVTRTGSTDTAMRFFYNVDDGHQLLTIPPIVNTGSSTGQYFSGPLCPLNTTLPAGTVVGYVVDTQGYVVSTTRSNCATQADPALSDLPANLRADFFSHVVEPIVLSSKTTLTMWRLSAGEGLAQQSADQRPIAVAVMDVYDLASSARDFAPMGGEASFSIGQRSTNINVIPSDDSSIETSDGSEPLTVTLLQCPIRNPAQACIPTYNLGNPSSATITLLDGPYLDATASDPFASPSGAAGTGTLTISRTGETAGAQPVWTTIGGTAPSGAYTLSDSNGPVSPGKHFTYNVLALGMASGYISGPFYNPEQGPYNPDQQADQSDPNADNPRDSSHPPDADDPQENQPILYLVPTKGDVVYNDANGNPGCACQLPSHRIPIFLPDLPQVAGSSTGVENFNFNVQIGQPFHAGDVVATFDVPTVAATVPAGKTSTALTVTPTTAAPRASTVTMTASFVQLLAQQGGYLSGPLAGGNSPPSVGKPIAYLVATPQEVLPAGSANPPPNGTPVKMPQFGDGTSTGLVTSFSLQKHIGDSVAANDLIAILQVPVDMTADGTGSDAQTTDIPAPAAGFLSGPLADPATPGNAIAYVVATAGEVVPASPNLAAPVSGFLSGPLTSPAAPGAPIAYVVPSVGDIVPATSSTPPASGTAIPAPQNGVSSSGTFTVTFSKTVGDPLQQGDTVAAVDLNGTGTPIIMPQAGTGSGSTAGYSVNFLKGVGDSVASGDTVATSTVPESADITAPAAGLFCPLSNLDPASPPAPGQTIGFINTNPTPSCATPQGVPVKMADVGSNAGAERSLVFLKDVRSAAGNVQSGDIIAKVIAPETATDAAEEGKMVYIANGPVSPIVDVIANQCGQDGRLMVAGSCTDPTITNNLITITARSMDLNLETAICYDWTATDSSLLNNAVHPTAQSGSLYAPYSSADPNPYPANTCLSDRSLVVDPGSLSPGIHAVHVTITDTGNNSTQATLLLNVKSPQDLPNLDQDNDQDASLPAHSDDDRDDIQDDDGDFIPNVMEGYGDSDNDGIPNYLDSRLLPDNVLQEVRLNASAFLMVADQGLTLSLGDVAFAAGADAADVTFDDLTKYGGPAVGPAQNTSDSLQSQQCIANPNGTQVPGNPLPQDMRPPSCYPPYVYQDFNIGRIPQAGGVAHVVIPQQYGLPVNPLYRVFHPDTGWQAFVDDGKNNTLSSCCGNLSLAQNNAGNKGNYPGSNGNCPPPGSSAYTPGLTQGYKCVELTIQDGGPNDTDGVANHVVADPSVVASAPRTAAQVAAGGGELVPAGAGALAPLSLGGLLGLLYITGAARRRAARRLRG